MKLWDPLYRIDEAEWVVVGVPFAGKVSSFKGCEKAPDAIRRHFQDYWTYDIGRKRDLFDEPVVDVGDVKAKTYSSLEKELTKKINDVKKKNARAKMLFIGGDHSITPIITKALNVRSYLCLDAHFDLTDAYKNDVNSHACANRRVYEQTKNVHLRGIRSGSREEHEFGDSSKIDWRKDIGFNGKVDYFSLDADVMDPAYVGTGTPEALGFTPDQIITTIRNTEFQYFDLVEWIPDVGYAYAVQIIKEVLFK